MNLQEAYDFHRKSLGTRWTFEISESWKNCGQTTVEVAKMDERGIGAVKIFSERSYEPAGVIWRRLVELAINDGDASNKGAE